MHTNKENNQRYAYNMHTNKEKNQKYAYNMHPNKENNQKYCTQYARMQIIVRKEIKYLIILCY